MRSLSRCWTYPSAPNRGKKARAMHHAQCRATPSAAPRPVLPARRSQRAWAMFSECSPSSSVAERREYDDANAGRASAINRGDGMCEWVLRPEISDMKESYSSAFLITDDVPGVGFSFQFKAGNKVQ